MRLLFENKRRPGKLKELARLGPGESFGEALLLKSTYFSSTAVAAEETKVNRSWA